jgi:hypothetical protein
MADKSEPRFNVDLPIRVFGVDADDRVFSQVAHAQNISEHGAKLVDLKNTSRPEISSECTSATRRLAAM